ncbi:MAG: FecR domain-containing protein [Alphaproteobacteria bacterium]|nr:FecR domain-containing protein [Alphaproteobacteria bacterium]MBU0793559.1 FecR domain-containing protein [Alphaproteobacteria bacterium]MBU0876410.1 FecR domain-containing protein [Alphaproteobacteria bacterium]MBU1770933.1 FecR domain-containing protein [Alphaproteobacteria bacterium]
MAALDSGSADMEAFEAWRNSDVRSAVAFAEVASTWRDMDSLRLAQGDMQVETPAVEQPSRRYVIRAAASIAATVIAGSGIAYNAYARDTASTDMGERRTVSVDDGLAVDLNTDSCIHWRTGQPTRLWLERGEVAIRLAAAQKAELRTPGGTFQLMPGIYNARLRDASCELAVVKGSISGAGAVHIGQGEIALATAGRIAPRSREEADIDRVTAWQRDTLVLNGESLDYALAEINRYLPNKIVIGDPALSRIRLGGTFATTNPEEFLDALRTSFGIRATPSNHGGIILTRP